MEVFTRAMELASLLEKAMHGGKQALEEYKKGFKAFLSYGHIRRPLRYSRIVLASVFFVIPELQYEDDQNAVLNLGDTMSKYLLYDLENAINAAYKGAGSSQSDYRQ